MDWEAWSGVGAWTLIIGFPVLLFVLMASLARLEEWMLHPDERAAEVAKLLEQLEEAEEVEHAVARMLAGVTDGAAVGRRRFRIPRRHTAA